MRLIRQRDKLVKEGLIQYVEYNEAGYAKKLHEFPQEGFACVVYPGLMLRYTWMTSEIIEVISETEFKTKNSHYKIEE